MPMAVDMPTADEAHPQRHARAVKQTGKHVAPEFVGAEEVLGRGRHENLIEVQGSGIKGGYPGREQRKKAHDEHDGQPREKHAVSFQGDAHALFS